MGISKRMLVGTAVTGMLYFIVGETLYRGLSGRIPMPLLMGCYFLGLMVFVILGLNLIGATMRRSIRGYKDIVWRCILLCLAILAAAGIFEFIYEISFSQKFTNPGAYVFLMDSSGSMEDNDPDGKRYEAVGALLENKDPDFRFAVYSFANSSKVVRPMGPVSQGTEFDTEKPNGGTGIKTVLEDVYRDMDRGDLEFGKNGKILLFTDGYATDMDFFMSKAQLNKLLEQYSKKGISISTVGLGSPDDELMEMIAKKTQGVYVRAEDAAMLEEAMKEAVESTSDRNLLDYRSPVQYDFLCMLVRFAAVLALGLLLGLVKMYLCEPFLDTRLLWVTSVACSLAAASCVELGMNKLGLPPELMRFFMCVLLAEGTLLKAKPDSGADSGDWYRNY